MHAARFLENPLCALVAADRMICQTVVGDEERLTGIWP
jgi:hypothetical protein